MLNNISTRLRNALSALFGPMPKPAPAPKPAVPPAANIAGLIADVTGAMRHAANEAFNADLTASANQATTGLTAAITGISPEAAADLAKQIGDLSEAVSKHPAIVTKAQAAASQAAVDALAKFK